MRRCKTFRPAYPGSLAGKRRWRASRKKRMKRNSFVYGVTKKTAQRVFPIFYQIKTERETTLGNQGPMIILPKHQFWTDIPIVSLAFEPLLYFVAKQELFKYPLIRNYLAFLGGLPVDRKKSIRTLNSFKMLLSLLRAGEKIVIFPEGTYFRNRVGSGKSRLLEMILRLQPELGSPIPFIPVGIRYGERSGWRRRVEVCIGSPLFAEGESDAVPLTHYAMEEIRRLCRLPRQSSEFACLPDRQGVQNSESRIRTLRTIL